ncbi:hypothetical protein J5N97_026082 [Dioscorea zingiberensis]|uniref:Uncharacterized protein n=1 Tax=Dioscorea zingiberensis TaxID=325984 RepID=A0A9D5C2R1_9LILI|nr:hypothetical protein J5N97_026082 [Dioscorea zingiberensis]
MTKGTGSVHRSCWNEDRPPVPVIAEGERLRRSSVGGGRGARPVDRAQAGVARVLRWLAGALPRLRRRMARLKTTRRRAASGGGAQVVSSARGVQGTAENWTSDYDLSLEQLLSPSKAQLLKWHQLSCDFCEMGSCQNFAGGWLVDYGLDDEVSSVDFIWLASVVDDAAVAKFIPISSRFISRGIEFWTRVESCTSPGTKACLEKMRRDKLTDRLADLCSIFDPARPPKADKGAILSDTNRLLN